MSRVTDQCPLAGVGAQELWYSLLWCVRGGGLLPRVQLHVSLRSPGEVLGPTPSGVDGGHVCHVRVDYTATLERVDNFYRLSDS